MNEYPPAPKTKAARKGNFFAIELEAWCLVCDQDINAAVAYLVMARGSWKDNSTTKWSVRAVARYGGIWRRRAKEAIDNLIALGLVELTGGTQRKPIYKIRYINGGSNMIWLPNELVGHPKQELRPISLLRETQDIDLLRLLIDLYFIHDLPGDGGVNRRELVKTFSRHEVGERGAFKIWGFLPGGYSAPQSASFAAAGQRDLIDQEAENEFKEKIFAAILELERLGFFEFVVHLVESNEHTGEIIHPLPLPLTGLPVEQRLTAVAGSAARGMLTDGQRKWAKDSGIELLVPIRAHLKSVAAVGIARMRFRPKTAPTAEWMSRSDEWEQQIAKYLKLSASEVRF